MLLLLTLCPFYAALPFAIGGRHGDAFFGLIGLVAVMPTQVGARLVNGDYRRLDKRARARVREVERTGVPSGDRTIDSVAAAQLRKAIMSPESQRIVASLLLCAFAAVPIIAALRVSVWWLLGLVSVVALAFGMQLSRRHPDPGERLAQLLAALAVRGETSG